MAPAGIFTLLAACLLSASSAQAATLTTRGADHTWTGNSTTDANPAFASVAAPPVQSLPPTLPPNHDGSQTSHLELAHDVTFFHGQFTNRGSGPVAHIGTPVSTVANVTIPQLKYPAVMLEKSSLVANVSCTDGEADVTFTDDTGFSVAVDNWGSMGPIFFLITYAPTCGDKHASGERSYLNVSSFTSDAGTKTIHASITHVDFQDLVDEDADVEITIGDWKPTSQNTSTGLGRRDLDQRWSHQDTYSFSTPTGNVDTPWGKGFDLWQGSKDGGEAHVYCVNCGVQGSVTFSTSVTFSLSHGIKVGALQGKGQMKASIEMGVVTSADVQQSFTAPIGQVGLSPVSIPGILSLDADLGMTSGATLDLDTAGKVLGGLILTWDQLQANLDIMNPHAASVSGFTDPQLSTVYPNGTANLNADASAYLQGSLSVGFTILQGLIAKKSVSLIVKPQSAVSANSSSVANSKACGGLDYSIGLSNDIEIDVSGMQPLKINHWDGPQLKCNA
ncbi:MAG: hypothetical protein M1838_002315 [Thelocarpon superellum]|nr:MAG: hypothetical protein M1838_002315 [Thelocarpon superellum]